MSKNQTSCRYIGVLLSVGEDGFGLALGHFGRWPFLSEVRHQDDVDDGERAINGVEHEHRGEYLTTSDGRRDAGLGFQLPEYQPGLPAHLGEDPAEAVREERARQ